MSQILFMSVALCIILAITAAIYFRRPPDEPDPFDQGGTP